MAFRIFETLKRSFYALKKKETLPSISSKSKGSYVISRPSLKSLQIAYLSYPPVFRAINIRTNEIMARGYELVSKNQEARKMVKRLFEKTNFDQVLQQAIIDTYVFGNGYIEKIFDGDEIVDFAIVHPTTMDFKRDGTGNIIFDEEGKPEGYVQTVGTEKVEIERKRIAHFVFHRVGDELLGISLIEPMYKTIQRIMNIDEGMAQAIWRLGFPFIHQKIGNETIRPTREEIEQAAAAIENLNAKSDITTPWYYDIKVIESKEMKGVDKYTDPFINLICSGSGVPKFILLGIGESTNKATAQEHSKHFRFSIESDQRKIKQIIEDQIIKDALIGWGFDPEEDMVYLEWNELLPEYDEAKVDKVIKLVASGLITKEEAREMLGLPPLEGERNEDNNTGVGSKPQDTKTRKTKKNR